MFAPEANQITEDLIDAFSEGRGSLVTELPSGGSMPPETAAFIEQRVAAFMDKLNKLRAKKEQQDDE